MLKEKLGSITEHISNIHVFPNNSEHKSCSHEPLETLEGGRSKAWQDPDSLVHSFLIFVSTSLIFSDYYQD